MNTRRNKIPIGAVIAIILVVSFGLGFLFDFVCTKLETRRYPRKYSEFVEKYAEQYDIPEEVVYAVIHTESGFDSSAVSAAGAVGLMQLTPATFEWLTNDIVGEHLDTGMLYDPETNIRYGCFLLDRMFKRYGSWETVHAAYNAGTGRVDGWLKDPEISDGNGNLINIPFKETRAYVVKIAATREKYVELYYKDK